MGICQSAEQVQQRALSHVIQEKLANDNRDDRSLKKLLLLGAGESGKSTIFKQMKTIYGPGFREEERKDFLPFIFENVVQCAIVLAYEAQRRHPPTTPAAIQAQGVLIQMQQQSLPQEEITLSPSLARHIAALWADPGIQKTYALRSSFQLPDSCQYFMDKVQELATENYQPSGMDVLRVRVKTSGIVTQTFNISGNEFVMFDVGGQRNERRKWIHAFEGVTAVIFVADLSAYDQVLYEDDQVNRVAEALTLFKDICNSEWFLDTAMILFLNKVDLFREKYPRKPLTDTFPDYTGRPDVWEDGVQYLTDRFVEQKQDDEANIYTHVTCATDTGNVSVVFNAVKDIIIQRDLGRAGLT